MSDPIARFEAALPFAVDKCITPEGEHALRPAQPLEVAVDLPPLTNDQIALTGVRSLRLFSSLSSLPGRLPDIRTLPDPDELAATAPLADEFRPVAAGLLRGTFDALGEPELEAFPDIPLAYRTFFLIGLYGPFDRSWHTDGTLFTTTLTRLGPSTVISGRELRRGDALVPWPESAPEVEAASDQLLAAQPMPLDHTGVFTGGTLHTRQPVTETAPRIMAVTFFSKVLDTI
jgi:hypothetical protein